MKKVKRILITVVALVCALTSVGAISANAASTTIDITKRTSSKVSCIVSYSNRTTIVIKPLQCRAKRGNKYILVTDTNSGGSTTSVYSSVVPGSGWKLVSSVNYDYLKYRIGSNAYSTHYYWA